MTPREPNPNLPAEKPMTEKQKRAAGLPFDSAKLYQEMNDDGIDAISAGIRGDEPTPKPAD
jgi:hypothetical protein